MDDPNVLLGTQMRRARDSISGAGTRFSPEAMARALRVTRDTIVRWEAGEVKPPFDRLVAYCRVLRMRGFPGREALQIICSGYAGEVEELQKFSERKVTASDNDHEKIEVATLDLLEEIRDLSNDLPRGHTYFDNLFKIVEDSLTEQNVLLESWSSYFGLGDSEDARKYTARRGYKVGWSELEGKWCLVVREAEIRTYKDGFLDYRESNSFRINEMPLAGAPLALKQQASAELTGLLKEIKLKLLAIPGIQQRGGSA